VGGSDVASIDWPDARRAGTLRGSTNVGAVEDRALTCAVSRKKTASPTATVPAIMTPIDPTCVQGMPSAER